MAVQIYVKNEYKCQIYEITSIGGVRKKIKSKGDWRKMGPGGKEIFGVKEDDG